MKRLRVVHVIVQPVLVWDDGDDLTPGPAVQPAQVPLSALGGLADAIRSDVADAERGQPSNEATNASIA